MPRELATAALVVIVFSTVPGIPPSLVDFNLFAAVGVV